MYYDIMDKSQWWRQ